MFAFHHRKFVTVRITRARISDIYGVCIDGGGLVGFATPAVLHTSRCYCTRLSEFTW